MSQLQITNAGIDYRNAVFAGDEVQNITHFIFANMPGQDASAPIDPNTAIPASVLHTQPIKAVSKVDGNAIVISAVLGYDVGDFEYNWYGVVATKQNGEQVLIAVVTTEIQNKTKTVGAVTGNYSVKSIVWRNQNIADDLNITLAVLPWQVQEEELVSKAVFDAHNHDDSYLTKVEANNYAIKFKENKFSKTQQIDTTGTALIIGGSSKQGGEDVSVYFGNDVGQYGYYFTYVGSGTGNENALEITTTNVGSPKKALRILQDGTLDISQLDATVAGNIIWHEGNMGANSGLNADLVDGLHANQLLRSDTSDTMKGYLKIDKDASYSDLANNAPSGVGQLKIDSGNNAVSFGLDSATNSRMAWIQVGHNASAYPSSNVQGTLALNPMGGLVTVNGSKVWHSGNMGAGSDLDAGKLGGQTPDYYAKAEDVKTPVPAGAKFTDTNTWREVLDELTSYDIEKSLSANQGRILKQMLDQVNALIMSDDTTPDEIQEVVNYIKQNRDTLDSLSIDNIAGLQEELEEKLTKVDAASYAHKNKKNVFSTTQQIDTTGTALIIGGSSKQGSEDVSVYFGNDNDTYGYYLTYVGSGNTNENALEITSTNVGNPKKALRILQDGTLDISQLDAKVAGNIIWHAGNMGEGSGLNADKLDGLHASQFARTDAKTNFSNPVSIGGEIVENSGAIFQVKGFMRVGSIYLSEGQEAEGSGVELSNSNGQLYWHSNKIIHHGNMGAGSGVDADKLDGKEATYFAKEDDLKSLSESRKFTRASSITNFRRHSLGAGSYTVPSLREDGSDLEDQDWFSVRAVSGEPVLNIKNGVSAKFKRLLDDEIDTQVTIVADDKNERVFVFNKTDNLWEF